MEIIELKELVLAKTNNHPFNLRFNMSNQSDVKQLLDKHNHTSLQNQQVDNIIDIFMDRDHFDLCIFPVDDQLQPLVVTDLLCTDSMRK